MALRLNCQPFANPGPTLYWIFELQFWINIGVFAALYACLLEGRRVPTFPVRLCRPHQLDAKNAKRLTGLQLTSALGNAVALLTKHGLDTERRKEFPVEAAMESLLSQSMLMVSAAPDMDLMSCINYFLDRCVDDAGQIAKSFQHMSVSTLLRGACRQHTLTPDDIPELRSTAERCIQVCMWV